MPRARSLALPVSARVSRTPRAQVVRDLRRAADFVLTAAQGARVGVPGAGELHAAGLSAVAGATAPLAIVPAPGVVEAARGVGLTLHACEVARALTVAARFSGSAACGHVAGNQIRLCEVEGSRKVGAAVCHVSVLLAEHGTIGAGHVAQDSARVTARASRHQQHRNRDLHRVTPVTAKFTAPLDFARTVANR